MVQSSLNIAHLLSLADINLNTGRPTGCSVFSINSYLVVQKYNLLKAVMNTLMFSRLHQNIKHWVLFIAASILFQGCFLFPSAPAPEPTTRTTFMPAFEWLRFTTGVVMDVNSKYVTSVGEKRINGQNRGAREVYTYDGVIASSGVASSGESGLSREIVADDEPHFGCTYLDDVPLDDSQNYIGLTP